RNAELYRLLNDEVHFVAFGDALGQRQRQPRLRRRQAAPFDAGRRRPGLNGHQFRLVLIPASVADDDGRTGGQPQHPGRVGGIRLGQRYDGALRQRGPGRRRRGDVFGTFQHGVHRAAHEKAVHHYIRRPMRQHHSPRYRSSSMTKPTVRSRSIRPRAAWSMMPPATMTPPGLSKSYSSGASRSMTRAKMLTASTSAVPSAAEMSRVSPERRRSASRATSVLPLSTVMMRATSLRTAFSRAAATASGSVSTAMIAAAPRRAAAMPKMPEPVPTSTTT